MRSPRTAIRALWIVALMLLVIAEGVAAETLRDRRVSLPSGETTSGDLVADGGTVEILGRVRGDLTVRAGFLNQVGAVSGAVAVYAGRAELRGPIGGSVRATGASLNVYGEVAGDVELIGGELRLVEGAVIGGDLIVRGGTVTIVAGSRVDNDMRGSVLRATIEGAVLGDVDLAVHRLTVAPGATIGGTLRYESRVPAEIRPGAMVSGPIDRHDPADRLPAGDLLLWHAAAVPRALALLLLGTTLVLLLPCRMVAIADAPRRAPTGAVLTGLGVVLFAPLVLLMLALLVVTLPLALLGGTVYLTAAYSSMAIVGLTLGRAMLRLRSEDTSRVVNLAAVMLGVAVLAALRLLPLADWISAVAIVIIGFGALINQRGSKRPLYRRAVPNTGYQPVISLLTGVAMGIVAVVLALAAMVLAVVGVTGVMATASRQASFVWKISPAGIGVAALLFATAAITVTLLGWGLLRWRGV